MSSENRSPSYLRERAAVRSWLASTRAGQYAADKLKQHANRNIPGHASKVLDDDRYTDFAEIYREYEGGLLLAASNREKRQAFERGDYKASKGSKLLNFFSAPLGYVLRRQVEEMDPDYWNDLRNVLREALANPEWCTVPPDFIRGELDKLTPKGKGVLFDATGTALLNAEPEPPPKPDVPSTIDGAPAIYAPPAQTPPAVIVAP